MFYQKQVTHLTKYGNIMSEYPNPDWTYVHSQSRSQPCKYDKKHMVMIWIRFIIRIVAIQFLNINFL